MKQSEIKELATKDLIEKIEIEKKMYTKLKISHCLSNIENPMKIVNYRRTIARLKTELNKRNK